MKSIVLSLAVSVAAIFLSPPKCDGREKQGDTIRIRIMSYNVRNCKGMDGLVDYERVANIIKRIDPDIVALQELDSATMRSKGVVVAEKLSSLTGMHMTYGASIDYQGGKYGVGMLTREKPSGWRRIPLPGREEPRSLLIVRLKKIVVACTHFSLTPDDRLSSAAIVTSTLKEYSSPVILAGDLNAVPESPVIKSIERTWQMLMDKSVPTAPSGDPKNCIDYILGLRSAGFSFITKKAVVEPETVASDHLPIWTEVEICLKK